jgi:hypothetical protein
VFIGPRDVFDTLVETNWTSRFESFTDDELRRLRLYDQLADELGRRSFFSSPQRLSVKLSVEESYSRLEHAGEDSLRSMAMTFRHVWQPGEPANFDSIRSLLRSRAAPSRAGAEAVGLLDVLGKRFKEARREEMMKHVWEDDPMGKPKKVFRASQVVDDWINGYAFHKDSDKAERVASWSPTQYEWTLTKAINEFAGVIWELHIVVMGALSAVDELATAPTP